MTGRDGDANQHIGDLTEILQIAGVLSIPVLFDAGITSFEEAVVAALTIVALLLVIE